VTTTPVLRLRPPRRADEAGFAAAHTALAAEGFTFGHGYQPARDFVAYLERLEAHRRGQDLAAGWVPTTFLIAEVAGQIVGRASIRHELNEHLRKEGGHIGYAVLRPFRRRGYATEILRQSLVVARALGVDRVLVTCDDDNVGSAAVIASCGGVFDSLSTGDDGQPVRRYWIS
jgi:predicted acetyltransferase